MVDEFSAFRADAQACDRRVGRRRQPCARAVFLMRVGHPDIDIEAEIRDEPMRAQFDRPADFARGNNINATFAGLTRGYGLDGLGCVLDDVGSALRNQPAVKLRPQLARP